MNQALTKRALVLLLVGGFGTAAGSARAQSEAPAYTIFMLVKTTDAWLALTPEARFAFLGSDIEPILERHPDVRLRFFDTEFFNSDVTDVLVWETTDLADYQRLVERLRESRFWGHYFTVVSILPGVENAYAVNYGEEPLGQ